MHLIGTVTQIDDEDGYYHFRWYLEFNEKLDDWIQYSERLEYFFTANDIDATNKKTVILLTVIETKAYKLL